MRIEFSRLLLVCTAVAVLAGTGWAQDTNKGGDRGRDDDRHQSAPSDAAVDFGLLPTAPLGPAPCLQSGAIGGPADPCAYMLHHLTPEEVTITKTASTTS